MTHTPIAVLWAAAGLFTHAAHADEPLWELGLGAGALRLPHYRGSDQSRTWLLPIPYFVYRGDIFRADREGAHARLLDSQRVDVDISIDASTPARSNDNRARAGLPDLAPTLEVGPNLNLRLAQGTGWKLDLRLPARAVFTVGPHPQAIGWRSSPAINLDLDVAGWDVALQGGPVAANRRYHGYFYSVAPAYATASRAAYQAPGGAAGWTFTAGASRRVGNFWLGSYLQADSLNGAVFNASPLVRQRQNLSFGVGMSWIFAVSGTRVADRP